MKTMKRELAKTGMFGQDGTKVTARDLRECAATFDGKGPVVLGHQLADWMPKFGDIRSVKIEERDAENVSLVGEVEVNDLLADAIDAKLYEDWSLGIATRKADGKRYIHHLAFLGAVPPKIRDLRVFADVGSVFLGDGGLEGVTEFGPSSEDPTARAMAVAELQRRRQSAKWTLEDAMRLFDELGAWTIEMALSGDVPEALKQKAVALADRIGKAKPGKEEDVELKEENAQLKKDLADLRAGTIAAGKESLKKAMEGRVPKAKHGLVLALADRLADAEVIELADEQGGKEAVGGIEVLRRIFEAIPLPIKDGKADLGDPVEAKPLDLKQIQGKF